MTAEEELVDTFYKKCIIEKKLGWNREKGTVDEYDKPSLRFCLGDKVAGHIYNECEKHQLSTKQISDIISAFAFPAETGSPIFQKTVKQLSK